MITNDGKELIGKFLINQASEYATHISIGCGARPLTSSEEYPSQLEIQDKKSMDFEMTRFPITSKGFVDDNGTTKIVFTSEIPSENRYDITEVALWSASSNNLATNSDSKMIFNFSEQWESHGSSVEQIPFLSNIGTTGEIDLLAANNPVDYQIFSVSTSNETLRNSSRTARKEGPRFLNNKVMMRGDTSSISGSMLDITSISQNYGMVFFNCANTFVAGDKVSIGGIPLYVDPVTGKTYDANISNVQVLSANSSSFTISDTGNIWTYGMSLGSSPKVWKTGTWTATGKHIHLNSARLPISQNSSSDILRLAFSIIDKSDIGSNSLPDYVKIIIEFYKNEVTTTTGFAKKEIYLPSYFFQNSRYQVFDIPISNLITSEDFTAGEISICRIFCSIVKNSTPSSNFYTCLDGFRLDNISTLNPLYKMVAYSIVKNDGLPITKIQNSNNYIEFRLSMDTI